MQVDISPFPYALHIFLGRWVRRARDRIQGASATCAEALHDDVPLLLLPWQRNDEIIVRTRKAPKATAPVCPGKGHPVLPTLVDYTPQIRSCM
jgi:hypothetical protein